MDVVDQIRRFSEFLEESYKDKLLECGRKGRNYLIIQFPDLLKFDPELADSLLEEPDEIVKAIEVAVSEFDLPKNVKNLRIRFASLPGSQKILIRNIRSKHLGKFLVIEGIVRQKSDVRPQVTAAKFECPSCGNIINVLQLETKFKEPSRCGCGRKGKFRLINKELIDAQGITLEEAPEDLEGGEQPKRLKIFLKDDLVSPMTEKKTNPGSKILINGIVKEIPLTGRDGGKLTRFDLLFEANYLEAVQEDYLDIEISEEEEKRIKELAEDPKAYNRLVDSVAPSIFGHEKIKEALILQLVGGVRKVRKDGMITRGDMHVLLIGDPGSGKSQMLKRLAKVAPKARYVSGKGVSGAGLTASVVKDEFLGGWALEAGALPLCNRGFCMIGETEIFMSNHSLKRADKIYDDFKNNGKTQNVYYFNPDTYEFEKANVINVSKRNVKEVFKIKTDTGQEIVATKEHPFAIWDNGLIWRELNEIKEGDYLFMPRHFPMEVKNEKNDAFFYFMGLVATDGHLSKKRYTISFYTSSNELKKTFEELSLKLFSKKAGCSLDERTKHYHLFVCSKDIHKLLQSYGIPKSNKNIHGIYSNKIINASINEIKSFIIGIINGDGSVSNRKYGGIIDIISGNEITAKFYQKLLRKIGVISRVHENFVKGGGVVKVGNYKQYKVSITGISNIKLLYDERLISYKKEALLKIISRKDISWRIPKLSILLRNMYEKIPHFEKNLMYANSIRLSRIDEETGLSRAVLSNCVNELNLCNPANKTDEYNLIKKVLDKQILFPKVKQIIRIQGLNEVFNIQIDKKDQPNFVANFLLVHNCMIDEMDKMSNEDTSAMHEALEGQTITISKANIQATLRAETTVLAAANPKFGRFDPYGIIAEQINMPPALINRFDLIFPIKDLPDQKNDERLAKHVLLLHQNPDMMEPEIDTGFLRKYIAYVRQKCFPILTEAALNELKNYYVEMRNAGQEERSVKSVPISPRQLEALIRMAEASAKIRLGDKVLKKDARKAIDLLHYCLSQVGIDPATGKIDIDRIATGVSASQRSKILTVKEIIEELENRLGKTIPIDELVKEAKEQGLEESEVEESIEKLKRSGDVFEPRRGFLSRI